MPCRYPCRACAETKVADDPLVTAGVALSAGTFHIILHHTTHTTALVPDKVGEGCLENSCNSQTLNLISLEWILDPTLQEYPAHVLFPSVARPLGTFTRKMGPAKARIWP